MYCIVQWIHEPLFGVIPCSSIVWPSKQGREFKVGETICAKCSDNVYPAKIIRLSGEQKDLNDCLCQVMLQLKDNTANQQTEGRNSSHDVLMDVSQVSNTEPMTDGTGAPLCKIESVSGATETEQGQGQVMDQEKVRSSDRENTEITTNDTISLTHVRRLADRIETLEEDLSYYKSKVRRMEKRILKLEDNDSISTPTPPPPPPVSLAPAAPLPPPLPVDKIDEHRKSVAIYGSEACRLVLKTLAFRIFRPEEMRNKSITGKRSARSIKNPRPAMDAEKVNLLERLTREKCPRLTHAQFVVRLQNIQKGLRQQYKDSLNRDSLNKKSLNKDCIEIV